MGKVRRLGQKFHDGENTMTKDQIAEFLYEMSSDLLYDDLQWIDNLSCASPSYYTNAKERARQKSRERNNIIRQILEKIPDEQL